MLKLMIVGRRRGGMTVAQLHRYMVDVHGAAVLRCVAEAPDLTPRRYVQNHVFDASFRAPASAAPNDPFAVARDFVTQVWFDDPAQAAAAVHAPLYLEHLQPDEDRFVDQTSVVKLAVRPHEQYRADGAGVGDPAEPVAGGASKLFVFHQRSATATAEQLAAATLAGWDALLAEADHGIRRLVRNTVLPMPGPGPAPTVDGVDEVWLADDGAARRVAAAWQNRFDDTASCPQMAAGSGFVLLAHERVMFAGVAAGLAAVS